MPSVKAARHPIHISTAAAVLQRHLTILSTFFEDALISFLPYVFIWPSMYLSLHLNYDYGIKPLFKFEQAFKRGTPQCRCAKPSGRFKRPLDRWENLHLHPWIAQSRISFALEALQRLPPPGNGEQMHLEDFFQRPLSEEVVSNQ